MELEPNKKVVIMEVEMKAIILYLAQQYVFQYRNLDLQKYRSGSSGLGCFIINT